MIKSAGQCPFATLFSSARDEKPSPRQAALPPVSGVPVASGRWPIVGHLPQFLRNAPDFLLASTREFGDVVRIDLGHHPVYFVNHPFYLHDVLVKEHHRFEKGGAVLRARQILGNGLLTCSQAEHTERRRRVQFGFMQSRLDGYGRTILKLTRNAEERWSGERRPDLFTDMTGLALSIISDLLFKTDLKEKHAEIGRAMSVALEYVTLGLHPLGRLVRRFRVSETAFQESKRVFHVFVADLVRARLRSGRREDDLLSALIESCPASDSEESVIGFVRDELITMTIAGHESTATALTWAFVLLGQNPAIEAELHEELDRVLAGRPVQVEDVNKLPVTRSIFAETLRLYPPFWGITRISTEEHRFGRHRIPAGSTIGMAPYVLHRDPRFFSDPLRFNPGRWRSEEEGNRPALSYIPFGAGPRRCIGEQLSWMEGTLILAALGQKHRLIIEQAGPVPHRALVTLRPRIALPFRLVARKPVTKTPVEELV